MIATSITGRASAAAAFAAALVAGILAAGHLGAARAAESVVQGVAAADVFEALGQECYEAGMTVTMPSGSILDCSAVREQRLLDGGAPDPESVSATVRTHRIRFTLIERAGTTTIRADAWNEIEELGTVIEQPITSEDYLDRLQAALSSIGARLRAADAGTPAPWAGRYESEQAWHLDAHLRAVSYCDGALAALDAESLGRELQSVGVWPLGQSTRDRCEQLHQRLFEWGLARGDTNPTVAEYAQHRAALPPEQRVCTGRLALEATCP